jgi:hypothetical protein
MNKKILFGIIAAFAIAIIIVSPLQMSILALGIWVYLVVMIRKKKTGIFPEQMDPALRKKKFNNLKKLLIIAAIILLVAIVGTVAHNLIHGLTDMEEYVFLIIGLAGQYGFVFTTAGGLVIFLKGRQKQLVKEGGES